jgi:hypothetical protein
MNPDPFVFGVRLAIVATVGILASKLTGWITDNDEVEIAPAALAALQPGKNVMAVRASQTYGGQCIDVGIVEDVP